MNTIARPVTVRTVALALALAAAPLAACGGAAPHVEVKGRDTELAKIAGEWEGSYVGLESGRTGPVSFSLQLGRHTADGTVLMGGDTPLKIQFVAVQGGRVSGKIQPYVDPACACEVATEFVGAVDRDQILGEFTTTVVGRDLTQRGEWQVTRRR